MYLKEKAIKAIILVPFAEMGLLELKSKGDYLKAIPIINGRNMEMKKNFIHNR